MIHITDQMGRKVQLKGIPQRMVSVVPSQTELLFDLGLEERVVGITKFCVHPDHWFRTKTRIGGTKQLHLEKIRALQPDLLIANKEENIREQIEELALSVPVYVSDVHDLPSALEMIRDIGRLTDTAEKAFAIRSAIKDGFARFREKNFFSGLRTAYLIWKEPYMAAGADTFIHSMLQQAGLQNAFAGRSRYPVTTVEEMQELDCQLVLLSSEPYPFREQHIRELQQQLPGAILLLVDGETFSWFGSRLLQAPAYLTGLNQQIKALAKIRNYLS